MTAGAKKIERDPDDKRWVCLGKGGCGYVTWQPPTISAVSHVHVNTKSYNLTQQDES